MKNTQIGLLDHRDAEQMQRPAPDKWIIDTGHVTYPCPENGSLDVINQALKLFETGFRRLAPIDQAISQCVKIRPFANHFQIGEYHPNCSALALNPIEGLKMAPNKLEDLA